MSRPKILITNDDGIHAPGILSLWKAVEAIADVTIVAPLIEQSAMSTSITLRQPLQVEKVEWKGNTPAWSVSGTPADCVKLAISALLKELPDMIISGINRGSNAGANLLFSGTVGGVIVGALRGIPGIAFSCYDYVNTPYHLTESIIPKVINHALEHPLPHGTLLNVTFPPDLIKGTKGIKMTRQGMEHWIENPDLRYHPVEGHSYYWLGSRELFFDEHVDSDIAWLREGYTTVVPVHVGELTDQREYDKRKHLIDMLL